MRGEGRGAGRKRRGCGRAAKEGGGTHGRRVEAERGVRRCAGARGRRGGAGGGRAARRTLAKPLPKSGAGPIMSGDS